MHWFIFPSKDSTMIKSEPNQNMGFDEVLEISKVLFADTTTEIARSLIKFDLTTISQSIVDGTVVNPTYYLNFKVTEASEIPLAYTIMSHAVSQSWEMGVGTKFDKITTAGVSWNFRTSAAALDSVWVKSASGSNAVFVAGTTGSLDGNGGTWYTGSGFETSQSFEYELADIRMDVTPIVNNWLSGSIPNEGFILKHTEAAEGDVLNYGVLKFFSVDTNTVFPPTLEIAWDDSTFATGSLSELTSSDNLLYMREFKDQYKVNSKVKFRVVGRPRYPTKTFSTTSDFLTVRYLPSGSTSYSLLDAKTDEIVIPFSSTTTVSTDSSGNFFILWTSGLQVERFYKIIYKIENSNGTVEHHDNEFIFKLVR